MYPPPFVFRLSSFVLCVPAFRLLSQTEITFAGLLRSSLLDLSWFCSLVRLNMVCLGFVYFQNKFESLYFYFFVLWSPQEGIPDGTISGFIWVTIVYLLFVFISLLARYVSSL